MIQDNNEKENDAFEKLEHGSNNLLKKLEVNFENIKRIDRAIVSELEKRLAFAEDSVKIMLNGADKDDSVLSVFTIFDMLFDAESGNCDSFFVSENVIRENIFLCEYIFKCIDSSHRIAEYMKYYSEMQNKRSANIGDFIEKFDFYGGYRKKTANVKIKLNGELTFNKLLSYITICDFQIIHLNYDAEENTAHLIADIQTKNFLFNIFIGLIKYYKVTIDIID